MAGDANRTVDARWRVFVSHTAELREFPRGRSYIAAVERAVTACGHVIVDMADFPAADLPSANLCIERVESCDVYVAVLGTRYGSPVRDRPELSYTELEFETATRAGLERLVFMLDTEAEVTGIPPSGLIDLRFGVRQDAFRRRVQEGLGTRSFADPGTLGQLVERALRELGRTRPPGGTAAMPVRLAPRPGFLIGRDQLLASLTARLTASPGGDRPRLAVLCGLGGAGKTSVAVEYAHQHLAEVGLCWQFAAEDTAVLAAEFAVLAAQLGTQDLADTRDPVTSVHAVLARTRTDWLLVFDNATDRASVERFVPPTGGGRVLITTQSQHWPYGQALDVPVLGPEVAAGFLLSLTGEADQASARELATQLGGLPLALEQAGAYMQATGTSLAEYLALFRDRQAELLVRGQAAGHPADVATTLGLALFRLADQAPAAAGLLRLLAFLASEPVPLTLLLAPGQAASLLRLETAAGIRALLNNPLAVGDAVTALRHYSLVNPAGNGLVLVHRLVQAITQAQLAAEMIAHWKEAAAALVEAAVPADPTAPDTWPTYALLLPHARAVLDVTSMGMHRIARYLGHSGSYQTARDLSLQIADAYLTDANFGPDHPYTLTARHNVAYWTGETGDAAGARDELDVILPAREHALGADEPGNLVFRHELARWTGEAGDAPGARDQFATLLPDRERVLGPDHPGTLATRHSLAYWTGAAGDAPGARDQFAALLPDHTRVQGPDHLDALAARHNLAFWTGAAGDVVSARDQFATLLPDRERVLGPDHPITLGTRSSLASFTGNAGDSVGARDQFAALLPDRERVLGPEHPRTQSTRERLAYWTKQAEG